MALQTLYQPFEIVYKEVTECRGGVQRQNFCELVYVVEGTGWQSANKVSFQYQSGNMFLLTPFDKYTFKVGTVTKFFLIRFNDIYLKDQQDHPNFYAKDWVRKLEYIFHNAGHQPGCILRNPGDKVLVKSLVEGLIREEVNKELYYKELIRQVVNTILTLVARNVSLQNPPSLQSASAKAWEIIQYIHQHISNPEELRVEMMAGQFNFSANYLGEYFKKHTGESLQQFITHYKIRLVETRLLYSDLRIGEIALELNFTDESHLNRIFKKYRGLSPSAFRKQRAGSIQSVA